MTITYKGIGFDGGDFDPVLYPWAVASVNAAYSSGAGQGFLYGSATSHGNGTLPDTRLYGCDVYTSQTYRFDINNGTYTIRCAVGSVAMAATTGLSIDNDDGSTITLNSGGSIDSRTLLVADNTTMSDTAWIASNSGLGGGPGVTFTVTKGYVLFSGGGSIGYPRWIQFESSGVTLSDATLNTDHTNYTASATGGVTTSGSPVVTGLSGTSGMKTGMAFVASSVPTQRGQREPSHTEQWLQCYGSHWPCRQSQLSDHAL
jgi:hypothetical protein